MFKVKVDYNPSQVAKRVGSAVEYGQYVLDNAVIKDSNYYIPKDKGDLERSALLHSNPGTGEVAWNTPYARRLYYNPHYNFSTDLNPNARGLWFEEAKAKKRKNWIEQANMATKSRI